MKLNAEALAGERTLLWLLEPENPSVRYFTLTKLLGRPESDTEAAEARYDIMRTGTVPEILARQNEDGSWGEPKRFYTQKYAGTVWTLIVLAELGTNGADPRIAKACDFLLEHSQDRESGGFAVNEAASGGGRRSEVIPCLTGNMAFSLVRLGKLGDPRARNAVDWIVKYQRGDDGIADAPTGWPYDRYDMCWGGHTCHMGVVKALKALAAIPESARDEATRGKIAELAEYMLIHHIHKQSHNLERVSKPGWKKPGFPLMYQTDVLEILGILTDLGYRDSRMNEAVELVAGKRGESGRWKLENTFNGKTLVDIEALEQDSKWITLRALCALSKL